MILKRLIASFFALLFSLLQLSPTAERKCTPAARGSFLQAWYCADWDDARWDEETAFLREAGAEYLILQNLAYLDEAGEWVAWYPSALPELAGKAACDVLGGALKSCAKAGIRVFAGLADFADWWNLSGFSPQYDTVCGVMTRMQREIYETYAPVYGETLYGWYFVPEIDNVLPMKLAVPVIARGLNRVLETATALDPEMPVMLSPYYSESLTVPSVLATLPMWQSFVNLVKFRDGDIFCPQDAVGAGWTKEENLEKVWKMYAAAVEACPAALRLWANCECFTAGENGNVPAPLDRFVRQLETASRYAEEIVCFSLDHFYSPFADDAAYRAYLDYLGTLR